MTNLFVLIAKLRIKLSIGLKQINNTTHLYFISNSTANINIHVNQRYVTRT